MRIPAHRGAIGSAFIFQQRDPFGRKPVRVDVGYRHKIPSIDTTTLILLSFVSGCLTNLIPSSRK
jgi:hypothetical protein